MTHPHGGRSCCWGRRCNVYAPHARAGKGHPSCIIRRRGPFVPVADHITHASLSTPIAARSCGPPVALGPSPPLLWPGEERGAPRPAARMPAWITWMSVARTNSRGPQAGIFWDYSLNTTASPPCLVPTLCVGIRSSTLRVVRVARHHPGDAERPGMHPQAERGNEFKSLSHSWKPPAPGGPRPVT